ncbi:hypothetical protein D9M68_393570 [compost metagenome]
MVMGPMPIRRAACTYSLLRSTSVEPRTVRAYCTHPEIPMAKIRTYSASWSCMSRGSRPRATPSISSATRMAGNDSCTSAMRMMKLSTRPPA